ncbi:MAG TPA: RlmE family RNA methyltransferase [Woeseiaceae bacterium]|nr:RlmE family RNA methyltransferase [Woeseiaceae bacterium]
MSHPRKSGAWRDRQERDPYVRRARKEGYRSRAVYKLEQVDAKERLLRPGMVCVDLGAAPGGWSQYVADRLKGNVRIIAVDVLPMEPLPPVEFIQGDFADESVFEKLAARVGEAGSDLVMSDMAPNITGNRAVDQPRSMHLAELALDACRRLLKSGGSFVCKYFQGEGSDAFVAEAQRLFERVRTMKPRASRPGSREMYLVALSRREL